MSEKQIDTENEKSNLEEKTFRFEKYKFNVDLLKWLIGSVALVLVTTIIERGFKERTAGIQEMQAYDKYVEVILKADNIEDRWKLSEYFSTVTPTERLRDRWLAYKDSISEDYKIFKKLKEKEFELNRQKNALYSEDTLSKTDKKLNAVRNQLAPYEKRLINTGDINKAQLWENLGFSFLLNRDVLSSIDAFRNSENSYHQFHQVYEIAKYLNENKSKLINSKSDFWKIVFGKIANEYSWKMPIETKNKLIQYSK